MIHTYALVSPNVSLKNSQLTQDQKSGEITRAMSLMFSAIAGAVLAFAMTLAPTQAQAADTAKTATPSATPAKADAAKPAKKDEKTKAGDKKVTNVVIETSLGNIEVELNSEKAPLSVANFLKYIDKKHYDGLIFHRVISGFMIQGGGMDEKMNERKNSDPIQNEAKNGLKNDRGTIAMARTSNPHSATSQFFINTVDNGFLNHTAETGPGWGYAVFGKVTAGMDVVDKIRAVPTGMMNGMQDVPKTPVVIKSIRRK